VKALALAVLVCLTSAASWIDRDATARAAAQLYAAKQFDEAAAKYHEALVEDPDSPLLHYNAAAASYRQGKFDEAIATLGRMPTDAADDPRSARAAYNAGNAKYRLGAADEASNPQQALGLYAEALASYRRAMGIDPSDEDAKFNHEFVEQKIAELKKKLEEQQQQKEQQQDQQKQDDQQKDREPKPKPGDEAQDQPSEKQQPQDPQQNGHDPQDQRQQQQQQPTEPEQEPGSPEQPADGEAGAGEPHENEMSPREAEALLDGQRDQEVRPDEIVRRLQGAGVAEPGTDW